jgi:hypothetical protein
MFTYVFYAGGMVIVGAVMCSILFLSYLLFDRTFQID